MNTSDSKKILSVEEFDAHVERCLSMIIHHEEVAQISTIVKKIYSEKNSLSVDSGGE